MQEKLQELMRITEGPYRAFLYDCDGTLADNMPAHKAAFVKTAAEYGFEIDPAIIDELAGWPTLKVAEEIQRRYNVSFDIPTFSKRKSEVFVEDFIQQTEPIQFVVEHLKQHAGKKDRRGVGWQPQHGEHYAGCNWCGFLPRYIGLRRRNRTWQAFPGSVSESCQRAGRGTA